MRRMIFKRASGVDELHRKRLLKIGEVAQLSGIGIETLRFYEKSRVLDKPVRTESNYRLYGEEVLERLSFIKRAQVLGFKLEEIKRIIDEKREGKNPCAEVREIVRARLIETGERIKEMRRYRNELAVALAAWDEAGEMDGLVCGLIENTNFENGAGDKKLQRKRKK